VEETSLEWDTGRDDLVRVTRRRLDAVVLASTTATPPPGPDVIEALVDRVRSGGLDQLGWTRRARTLQSQAAFARSHLGGDWPDLSDAGLIASLDQWLPPLLVTAQGRADLGRVDMARVLRHRLGHAAVASIDEIAPATVTVSSGRAVVVDYASDPPSIEVRAQELFGTNQHPAVGGGRVPLTVHLLSPAGRPIQVTADLPGFWKGSWNAVRKDMAGRYPKHNWPSDPTTAEPSTRAQRRR
jgi:ATP-dependent helicase HrpB